MISKEDYSELVKKCSPNSKSGANVLKAFAVGGIICCIGQALRLMYGSLAESEELASMYTSVTLIFLGVLLTGLGVYDKIARFAGAGTLVPITGFANSMASPAIEFKSEGFVTGMAAKMFSICGPVIVYGISAGMIYGIILALAG